MPLRLSPNKRKKTSPTGRGAWVARKSEGRRESDSEQRVDHNEFQALLTSLAQRQQHLLDRQIQLLDRVEKLCDDPEQLGDLLEIDHLATRMRRHAESLLVLSGGDHRRPRAAPVPVDGIVRVAVGEVLEVERVNLEEVEEAGVSGGAAIDLAHLLAEVLESAILSSSAPDQVCLRGSLDVGGSYNLVITSVGDTKTEEDLASIRQLLAAAPIMGIDSISDLGFAVVSTLSIRHGIAVEIEREIGGVVVNIHLPRSLVAVPETSDETAGWTPDGEYVSSAPVVESALPATNREMLMPSESVHASPSAENLSEVLPEPDEFDERLNALLAAIEAAGTPSPGLRKSGDSSSERAEDTQEG